MEIGYVSILKVKYTFENGNEISGMELRLGPKVKKFINMSSDNIELMRLANNGLVDWYNRADYGDDIVLKCSTSKDRSYIPDAKNGDLAVNFN